MKKTKMISRTFAMLLAIVLVLGCMPYIQVFASERSNATTQSIWTSDGTDTTYEELPFSPSDFEFQRITTQQNHYYKDITLNLDFRGSDSSAPTVKVQGHDFTSFTYDNSGYYLEVSLKDVQAYASPSNNMVRIEITYAGNKVIVFVTTSYTNVDTTKPYLAGRDMWDFDNEQLPDVYSPVVIAQKAHRYTYNFGGALIMPDSESFQVTLDGKSIDGFNVYKKTSLGFGMSLYEFNIYSIGQYGFSPDADGYSTLDFIGTTTQGYINHVLLKCRFVYR